MTISGFEPVGKFSRSKYFIILGSAGTLILVGCVISYSIYVQVLWPHLDVRSPAQYEETIRSRWQYSGLISHFPPAIPKDAKNVRFFYRPSGLNRTSYLQLSYTAPHETVITLFKSCESSSLYSFQGGTHDQHTAVRPDVITTFFFTGDWIFPNDYTIYVLKLEEIPQRGRVYKASSGVAISTTRNDVVYWATVM